MARIRTRLAAVVLSAAAVGVAMWLPLDEDASGAVAPILLLAKCTACFAALLVPLFGYGETLLRACERLSSPIRSAKPVALPPLFRAWVAAFAGMILVGTAVFVCGLVLRPTAGLACAVLAAGYLGYLRYGPDHGIVALGREQWAALSSGEKALTLILFGTALIRVTATFAFQNHEDAYTANLAVAETWIRTGRTGVYLDNLYSGISLAPEHYYLALRLLLRGVAEQNAMAQLTHVILGHGLAAYCLVVLSRPWLGRFGALCTALFAMQSTFMFFHQLPKNDAYLVAAGLVAAIALLNGWPAGFVAAAAVPLVVKINGVIVFPAIVLGSLVLRDRLWRDGAWRGTLGLFTAAGVSALVFWGVFGANNFYVTGNPLMPIANNIFHSPFAPAEGTAILAGVPFFAFTWLGAVRSPVGLIMHHPLFAMGVAAWLVLVVWRRPLAQWGGVDQAYWYWLVIALANFFLLQIASGEFGQRADPRHFMFSLFLLLPLSLWPVWTILKATGRLDLLRWSLVALALSATHVDSFVKDFASFLASGSQTRAILRKKPVLDLNATLSRRVRDTGGTPIVLALSTENTPLFLPNARFWHQTFTYPVWSWKKTGVTTEEWRSILATHGIEYAIVAGDQPDVEQSLLLLPHTTVATHGRHQLIQFAPAATSGRGRQ